MQANECGLFTRKITVDQDDLLESAGSIPIKQNFAGQVRHTNSFLYSQGQRTLTLIPDFHLCAMLEAQIVDNLPTAMKKLEPSIHAGQPLTFISGPSVTSDTG